MADSKKLSFSSTPNYETQCIALYCHFIFLRSDFFLWISQELLFVSKASLEKRGVGGCIDPKSITVSSLPFPVLHGSAPKKNNKFTLIYTTFSNHATLPLPFCNVGVCGTHTTHYDCTHLFPFCVFCTWVV